MDIIDRLSKALRKRWSKHGCGPEEFRLNGRHWHQLYWAWSKTSANNIADKFLSPKPFTFLGTKLILVERGQAYGS